MVTEHKPDCDWHVDQYPWECTCAMINTPDHYWYRQGKDDGVQMERERIVAWLVVQASETPHWREALAWVSVEIERGEHLKDTRHD